MNIRLTVLLCAALIALSACQNESGGGIVQLEGDDSEQVARVNGKVISVEMLEAFAAARGRSLDHPEDRRKALSDLINLVAAADAAAATGITQDRGLAYQLMIGQLTTISNAGIDAHLLANPPSEEALKAEYEAEVARAGGTEYHLLHLLYSDEQSAKEARQALVDGTPFNELVDQLTEAGVGGVGDLGFINPAQLPESLAQVVTGMQKGEMTPDPVKSEFGWHLVVVMDTRDLEPPSFEEVAQGVRTALTRKQAKAYVEQARADAEVLIFSQ